jgi:hypothetical protein
MYITHDLLSQKFCMLGSPHSLLALCCSAHRLLHTTLVRLVLSDHHIAWVAQYPISWKSHS